MDDNYLTIIDENGNEILCEILFTFESDETKKSYVFYVPVETKDDEEIEVLCSSYIPEADGSIGKLFEIENDEEWDMLEEVFEAHMDSLEDEEDEDFDDDDECCCDDDDEHDCCCHHHDDEDEE